LDKLNLVELCNGGTWTQKMTLPSKVVMIDSKLIISLH
jgi:hypothetical protein